MPLGAPFSFQPLQGISDPRSLAGNEAWYDISDLSSLIYDGSNRVQLVSDKSGNSATNVLCLNGVAGNNASTPHSTAVAITGPIDIRSDQSLVDWTPGIIQVLCAKDNGTTGRCWQFNVQLSGVLRLAWSTDGSAMKTADSTVAPSVSDYGRIQLRTTLDTATGDVNFYTRTDGDISSASGWTQLGTTVSTAAGALFNGTSTSLFIGARQTAVNECTGNFYRAQIYNGIAGTLAFDANFTLPAKLATSFTESSVNAATVTVNTTGDFGARICGARDLVNMTVADMPTLLQWSGSNYGYLTGTSGTYFSTPDAAAVSITGDIDLRVRAAANDWTGAANQRFISKRASSSDTSYDFLLLTTGALQLITSLDGSTLRTATSSVVVPFSDLSAGWVRVTRDATTGNVTFYTAADSADLPASWTQLGTVQATTAEGIFNGTQSVEIGSVFVGTAALFSGRILRAQIYNGINGTLAFDFNPSTYSSGTTFLDSSVNGATITINGGAVVVQRNALYFDGSNDVLKAAAFALSQPYTRYMTFSAVTWTDTDTLMDGDTLNSGLIGQRTTTPLLKSFAGTADVAQVSATLGTRFVLTNLYDAASSLNRLNTAAASTGNPGASNPNGLSIGAAANGTKPSNITASEVVIYGTAATKAQQDAVILYLGRKWSISL